MSWFKRVKKGITTSTEDKKETPEGLWYKCQSCKKLISSNEHVQNLYVCSQCDYHEKIGSAEYFEFIFDNNEFIELNANLMAADSLSFTDTKKYSDRLIDTRKKTNFRL